MIEKLIYENTLTNEAAIADYVLEGQAVIDFSGDCMRLQNAIDNKEGQKAN